MEIEVLSLLKLINYR